MSTTYPSQRASKPISQFSKAELLALLDNFEDWTGKDALISAVQNATSDTHAQELYRIGIYLPFGKTMLDVVGRRAS